MLRPILTFLSVLLAVCASGQQASQQPQVKVNMLNVCSPSAEEKQEISTALSKIPRQPQFSTDFEVARGRSTMEASPEFLQAATGGQVTGEAETASWVRIRHELPAPAMFSTVQYSFSADSKNMVETLVFRVRDPKDLMQVSIEDSASAVTTPAAMLTASTPASRIKLERFGKSSVVLARCYGSEGNPPPDQSAYQAVFQTATDVMSSYRGLLGARRTVPDELSRVQSASPARPKAGSKPVAKKPTAPGS